jgi:hypothetical protein
MAASMATATTTMATATVTAAMMMTTTAAAAPFVAHAVGWLLHCCLPPAIVCHSSHAVMQSPTLLSPAAFTAFAAPVVGWYLHCRLPPDLVIARQCAIFNSLIAMLPPDALVASRCPPVPFPSMVGCCVVVFHPFSSSYPFAAVLTQTLSLPVAAHLCHSR